MLLEIGCNMYTSPPEVWANGGDMSDWTRVIGSGPWMIANYVAGSEITLSRNPDYFEMDPLHPDQMRSPRRLRITKCCTKTRTSGFWK